MTISVSMPTTDPNRLQVVVGVLKNERDQFLIQQRQAGKPRAGQWEYPGGKIESGESPLQALQRELTEELGVIVTQASFIMIQDYDYSHANVRLHVFLIEQFEGEISSQEGQAVTWANIKEIEGMDVLDAVYPINEKLASLVRS